MAFSEIAPDWWPFSPGTTAIVAAITVYFIAYQLSSRKIDPREPPVIAPAIPLIGHLLGMALLGGRYIKNLGIRNQQLPIFTLPVPGSRIYIVTDPSLAAAVQRASRVLSFNPVVPEVTQRVLGLDDATVEITRKNLDPGPGGERGFLPDIQDMVSAWLGPGDYLSELSLDAAAEMKNEIAAFASSPTLNHGATDLLSWVRHLVTLSTARYLYGPENPIALEPALEGSFWDFDHGLGSLLMNIVPSVTARRAYTGREKLSAALLAYLEAGRHKSSGSKIVQKRVDIALEHGWAMPAIAREELSFLFAGIVNATTSTFWILLHLYADPTLLATVRQELESVLSARTDKPSYNLCVADLRDKCPVLVAVYRECLRLGSDTYSTRIVKEDHVLANQYFLKKNAVVQIAGGVIHADQRIWGADVFDFNPRRFLDKTNSNSDAEALNPEASSKPRQKQSSAFHPAAFRAFGGGKTLCPGRHFAMNEILAFVALVVLQFDMKPARGGKIEVPAKNDGVLPVHILEPARPVKVVISKREDGFAQDGLDVEFSM
ncbi:25-hydroxycholesterol 7-alpha-hydroxylase [Daldinia childiae]|uniref:25-hydroxycholesterol 7-alpha-hydroxylase n=1 Tax=Daldinia childiae TaxID=326645 RepID=UPI001446AF0C|nr:25-hydroxycholesterol 7-alpha-hydroxylase [Daldinia childiae]KAF3054818.1 25-hydroxycholesterol 7-alpha-hydroxylase [Daldinia childiae]